VLSYPPGTLVPIAIATHALVGLAVGAVVFDRPLVGLIGGLAPDLDFLFPALLGWPFVHRGLTHTAIAVGVLTALAVVVSDRRTAGALAGAYGSHLAIDVTTSKGIPLLYPLLDDRLAVTVGIGGHEPAVTIIIWLICLGVVGHWLRSG